LFEKESQVRLWLKLR